MSNYTTFPQASGRQQGQQYPQANGSFYGFPQATASNPMAPFGGPSFGGFPQATPNGVSPFNTNGGFAQAPPATMSPQAMTMSPQAMMLSNPPPKTSVTPAFKPVASTSKQAIGDPRPAAKASAASKAPVPSTSNVAKAALAATPHLAPAPSATASTENAAWNRVNPELKAALNKERIRKSPLVTGEQVLKILTAFDKGKDVPIAGRREVLAALVILPPLPDSFFGVLIDDKNGIRLLENWLTEAFKAHKGKSNDNKANEALRLTLASMLRLLLLLPLSAGHIRGNLPKIVKQIQDDAQLKVQEQKFTRGVYDLANQLRSKWTDLLRTGPPTADTKKRAEPPTEDPARKKPKIEAKPTKVDTKPKVTTKVVTKAASPVEAPAPGLDFLSGSAKPDISALSIGRKKSSAVPASKAKESTPPLSAVAAPVPSAAAKSGFATALSGIKPKDVLSNLADPAKRNKKKLKVHWPGDADLVQIREIEAREEAGAEEHLDVDSARQMDVNEGARFRKNFGADDEGLEAMEALVEWYSPEDVVLPARDGDPSPVYPDPQSLSTFPIAEAEIQNERDAAIVPVFYANDSQIPPSPNEPPASDEAKTAPIEIPLAAKFAAMPAVQQALYVMASNDYSTPSGDPADHAASTQQLQQLLGMLKGGASLAPPVSAAPAIVQPAAMQLGGSNPLELLSKVDFTALFNPGGAQPTAQVSNAFAGISAWPTAVESQAGPMRNTELNRHIGSSDGTEVKPQRRKPYQGRKKIPCRFFAQGKCREGSECSFSHDTA